MENQLMETRNTLTSLEVAEMMEIEHNELLKKLEGTTKPDGSVKQVGIIPTLSRGNFPLADYYTESTYKDAQGKPRKCYNITKKGCEMLAHKMTGEKGIIFTAKYIERFHQMEDYIRTNQQLHSYQIEDSIERAQRWIEEEKERRLLEQKTKEQEQTINKQTKEIAYKEDVIIGLTKDIDLAEKRQRINQIVRHNSKDYKNRFTLLYSEFDKKYHVDITRRLENAKERGEVKSRTTKMDYVCNIMGMTNELYDLACKIFEGDFVMLLDEWKETATSNSLTAVE